MSFCLIVAVAVLVACQQTPTPVEPATAKQPLVFATNALLLDVGNSLAGDRLDLRPTWQADEDPAFAEPDDAHLTAIQQADLLLTNGTGYEQWLAGISMPIVLVVDTTAGIDPIADRAADSHRHGPKGHDHEHHHLAFTTWMDYRIAGHQVQRVAEALCRLLPAEADEINDRAARMVAELNNLDQRMERVGLALDRRPLITSHPVYQYWARRYDLDIESLHWEPDVPLDDQALTELDELRKEFPATVLVWEAEPLAGNRQRLDERSILSVVVAPAGSQAGHWLARQRANVVAMEGLVAP